MARAATLLGLVQAANALRAGGDPRASHDNFLAQKAYRDAKKSEPLAAGDAPFSTGIWPLPASVVGSGAPNLHINPYNFTIFTGGDDFLNDAADRYYSLILYHPNRVIPPAGQAFNSLTLRVVDLTVKTIQMTTDESYNLTFASDGQSAIIDAITVFGALRGLETFSQLVNADKWTGLYDVSAQNVMDMPRFPFRGLLVDAARHYLPPKTLLTIMDGMMYTKMNSLIVVLGCDWTWAVQSRVWPNLTQASYYSKQQDHIYNITDMIKIVSEANKRGVRFIPFFETVGHSSMLGEGYPELMWCNGVQGNGLPHPLKNFTWQFFDSLWQEYRGVFQDEYMLVGGDEIDVSCWETDPDIAAWMKAGNHTDLGYVVALYYTKMMTSLKKAGFKPIFFGDAWGQLNGTNTSLVGTDIIFDGWDPNTPQSMAPVLTTPGAKAIVSSYCFLVPVTIPGDQNVPGDATDESNYKCDVQNITGVSPEDLNNMLGGHASRWGEMTDPTNIFQYTWPALIGVAEKLWTPMNMSNYWTSGGWGDRQYELGVTSRCVFVRRGLMVAPVQYSWSCDFEMEIPYPPIQPSMSWWPTEASSSLVAEVLPSSESAIVRENAVLRARVQALEAHIQAVEEKMNSVVVVAK